MKTILSGVIITLLLLGMYSFKSIDVKEDLNNGTVEISQVDFELGDTVKCKKKEVVKVKKECKKEKKEVGKKEVKEKGEAEMEKAVEEAEAVEEEAEAVEEEAEAAEEEAEE